MRTSEHQVLNFVRFADLSKWSASATLFKKIRSLYPLVPLSSVLKRIKEPIDIEDEKRYRRITVRLYGQGVLERDELYGKDIGTKRQFIAREGQLIISRIDARNGAFGIVPKELDGAVVTNDFWLFEVQQALAQYIVLVLSSERFQRQWQSQSSGTTNRQRIDEDTFFTTKIALPPLETQRGLLEEYNGVVLSALENEQKTAEICLNIEKYLMDMLNLHHVEEPSTRKLLSIVPYKQMGGKWEWNELSEVIETAIKDCYYPMIPLGQAVSFVNRTWKKGECLQPEFMYIEIGGVDAAENTVTANKIPVSKAPSRATQTVQCGDLIIGTTRPYLKRFALIRADEDGYICSSGFQVIKESLDYDLRYILEVLKLEPMIKQFESLMTGALYPAVNLEQLKEIRVPIPPVDVQHNLSNYIDREKERCCQYNRQSNTLREKAKKEFEEAVFGEA